MKHTDQRSVTHRPGVALPGLLFALLLAVGCKSHSFYDFMPTPNMYGDGPELAEALAHVPEPLQTEWAEVTYVTDRVPGEPSDRGQEYGWERSRSAAFGTMRVHFGKDLTWDTLVERSVNGKRDRSMRVWAGDITEAARYPETPEVVDWDAPSPEVREEIEAAREQADEAFRELMAQRLAQTPDKDVYLFIHGYNSEFVWGPYVIAQLWHFMGRTGVPVAYTWPAARPGLLRGYQYDRESGEFTIFHLKRFLKLLASCPDVEKVHIIAHSRGTDVTTTALRELLIEHGGPQETRAALKLGVLVLAAADLDTEVVTQRLAAERVGGVPERFVFYVSEGDRAIGLSNWLYADERIGTLRPSDLREQGIQMLLNKPTIEAIDARIRTPRIFSHSYFFAHPAVSSDLILLLRDERPAGAAHGRPLERDPTGFWIINNDYPKPAEQ